MSVLVAPVPDVRGMVFLDPGAIVSGLAGPHHFVSQAVNLHRAVGGTDGDPPEHLLNRFE